MTLSLDPRLVFDRFVVGPGNRLAAGAGRRVAEAPGRVYNPLLVVAPAGCGKTHLLAAIGNLARAVQPGLAVRYDTADRFVDRLSESIAEGRVEALREAVSRSGLWLLDDLGAVAGRPRSQEELLRVWAEMIPRGAQVVVAVDRPLAGLPGLDPRLVERLAGGLGVEMAPPDARERLAMARQAAAERGVAVPEAVLEALARLPLGSARAVLEAVDRVAAVTELEGAAPAPETLPALLGLEESAPRRLDEFGALVADVSAAVAAVVETAPWRRRLAEAILRWEGEGIATRRLDEALDADSAPDVDALLRAFARDVARMREAARTLPVPPDDPALLADPDRLPELEALASAPAAPPETAPPAAGEGVRTDPWFLDRERFDWGWVALEDRLLEEQR